MLKTPVVPTDTNVAYRMPCGSAPTACRTIGPYLEIVQTPYLPRQLPQAVAADIQVGQLAELTELRRQRRQGVARHVEYLRGRVIWGIKTTRIERASCWPQRCGLLLHCCSSTVRATRFSARAHTCSDCSSMTL